MTKRMSEADENRLLDAVEDVAGRVLDGHTPTDAVIKVARELQLPPGHVGLLARGYNVARTTRQREDGDDSIAKTASFPLADASEIMAALYPEPRRKAASVDTVASEYLGPPTWYAERLERNFALAAVEKVACVVADLPVAPPLPPEPEKAIKTAYANAERRAIVLGDVRLKAAECRELLAQGMAKVAHCFRSGPLTPEDVRSNVEVLMGADGIRVIDAVAPPDPEHPEAARLGLYRKQASAARKWHKVEATTEPYASIREVIELADTYIAAQDLLEKVSAYVEAADVEELSPFGPNRRPDPSLAAPERRPAWELAKEASIDRLFQGFGTGLAYGTIKDVGMAMAPAPKDERVKKEMGRIGTPDHQQALREIEARTMLHDMLNHDSVLSGHDPYEVAEHFNRLSQFAPTTSQHALSALPLVRKSITQGNLDTFDANEVAGTEQKLRAAKEPKNGGGNGDPSIVARG